MATPSYSYVIDQINTFIVANGNNEITANVLNPILEIITDFANNHMGDLDNLTTDETDTLVDAINSLKQNINDIVGNSVQLHIGNANPNDVPPSTYNYGDFFMQLSPLDNDPIQLWQFNGFEWFAPDAATSWGDIEGNIADQTDLQSELDLKADVTDLVFTPISSSNFNYEQYISSNKLKEYLESNSLPRGFYSVKHSEKLTAIDNINLIYNNGEHNGFPSLTKTKEGKLITGYRASPVDHNSPIARAEIMISSDNGNTFGTPIVVDDGSDFTTTGFGIRNCFITQLSTGDLIATYGVNDNPIGNIYYKFSSDGGLTWGSRTTLVVTGHTPDWMMQESGWLEIGGEFILPIFSGATTPAEANAGFVRTPDFVTFTYTALDSDNEGVAETRGYIDNSNNTILFFYQYPVNPNAVLYRSIYDPINNVVISPKTAVNITDYSSSRSDILFDENRGEMYLLARKPYPQGGKICVSTDKGLNFTDLFDFDDLPDRTVYGDFVQVNQSEALFLFATEDVPNGETTKMWMTTFNLSPVQKFSYDGTNVTEINNSYIPKISDFTMTGDNRYVKRTGDVMSGNLQVPLLMAGGGSGGSIPFKIIGTGVGNASFGSLAIYESDGVTRQAFLGKASGANGHIYFGSDISGKALILESTGAMSYNGTIRATSATLSTELVTKGQLDAAARPYKVYTALLSQSGTSAPTAIVLENTLGGTVVWSRSSTGIYHATLSGAFITNKTICQTSSTYGGLSNYGMVIPRITGTNFIEIISILPDTKIPTDGLLSSAPIEIKVYT